MTEMREGTRRRGLVVWPFVVVGLLGLNVTVCVITVYASTRNPAAVTLEPDYYQRALDWEEEKDRWLGADAVGWTPSARAEWRDGRPIISVVVDGRDAAEGLRAEVFHKARADERSQIVLVRLPTSGDGGSEGACESVLPSGHAGFWEARIRDEAAGVRFTVTVELAQPPSESAASRGSNG